MLFFLKTHDPVLENEHTMASKFCQALVKIMPGKTKIGVLYVKGRTHDLTLLKRSQLKILANVKKYGDSGYQGLGKLYAKSTTPQKKPKDGALTKTQKRENCALASLRIPIEHVNRRCKIFRIVKEIYRGKHNNYHKTWTVVAALVNLRYDQNAQNQGN